jgi:hypothetical protein
MRRLVVDVMRGILKMLMKSVVILLKTRIVLVIASVLI